MFDFFARARARAEQDTETLKALRSLADSQAKTAEMVMRAVEKITDAQTKQIDAINTHLSLFRTTEPPTAKAMTGVQDNQAWLQQQGFPETGSPEEQMKWIMEHDLE